MFRRRLLRTSLALLGGATLLLASMLNGTVAAQSSGSATPAAAMAGSGKYAALGDSVAAGVGLPAGGYTSPGDQQCGRSVQGYPNSVAAHLHMQLLDAACTGATAGDLVTRQRIDGPNIPAQLSTAFAGGAPGLITITAGANDVHWNDFIYACYVSDCTAKSYTTTSNAYLALMRFKLNVALADIVLRSAGTPPTVIVTGYYNPFSSACGGQIQNITSGEISWLTDRNAALNSSIQRVVANYPFARFAAVDFSGHDLCSSDPWVLPQSAPTGALHPTAAGQQAIARSVLTALDSH